MRKLLFIILLFIAGNISAQEEFSFQLYFKDAVGNKDTLTIGYDPLATDTIDASFGEVNLVSQPWSLNDFEVYATNRYWAQNFKVKKQIITKPCSQDWHDWYKRTISILFNNAVFPINIDLSTNVKENTCINGSYWYLDGEPPYKANDLLYSSHLEKPLFIGLNSYKEPDDRTIIYYTLILADSSQQSSILSIDNLNFNDDFKIYPNPSTDLVTIDLSDNWNNKPHELTVFQMDGTLVKTKKLVSEVSTFTITDLRSGLYLFKITNEEGISVVKKVTVE